MLYSNNKECRKEVARFMRRLYKRGLTTASGGNISIRLQDGILITPSGLDKGTIKGNQIGLISFTGENLSAALKPSIEFAMHLAIYKSRPDVFAIVHAHPPLATSFTALQKKYRLFHHRRGKSNSWNTCKSSICSHGNGIIGQSGCKNQLL
jgi:ribulose-5-phosphate 4-epimerase/fuculose-1-phosphate aldolase